MTRLTFITGAQGVGKTLTAKALADQQQLWGRTAHIASETDHSIGDWSTAQDVEKLRDPQCDEHWFIDSFTTLPNGLVLQPGDVVIHMERAA